MMAANSTVFSNGVFCPPLPGKPGPYAADGVSRSRVPQSAQKGETCAYYAFQILEPVYKLGFCRFLGSFEPIFVSFSGSNIRNVDITPR